MFTSDVSEPYEILKRSILKRGDLTDRRRLDQLFNNIDLPHGSATDMLQGMREKIGLRTFDEGLFKQLFLSKLPQQVQAVLISFQNNTLDELAASADRILEITKSSTQPTTAGKERCSLRGIENVHCTFLFLLCCTSVSYSNERRPDAAKFSKLSEECLPTTDSLGLNFWLVTS
ncbi:unnamed protein product [Schistosoma margrebowiei]|uniref:Uncharacterized protein n=1 Tax=Schistosoma margrebowiei TaxID=48269 RepID=A0A183LHY5_9TREM|nr:unnamed protein product [Schistosoma margrebowiei]